jgi:arabinan endo-1,5-alpha-L-arabinosidase
MNNNYNDIIGGKTLFDPIGVSFTSDRLNKPSSALSINNGYIKAPSGVYFSGDFTVTSWFRSDISLITNCRLFDFGNGSPSNNILVSWNAGKAYITTFSGTSTYGNFHSVNLVKIGKWNHFAYTLKGTQLILYINGKIDITGNGYQPVTVVRTLNYLSRGNWGLVDPIYCYGSFDDFKIFNRSLTQSEILRVMNSYV